MLMNLLSHFESCSVTALVRNVESRLSSSSKSSTSDIAYHSRKSIGDNMLVFYDTISQVQKDEYSYLKTELKEDIRFLSLWRQLIKT